MQRADYLFGGVFKPQLDSSFIIYAETFDSSTLMQQCQQKTQDNETMYRLNYHNISLYVVFLYLVFVPSSGQYTARVNVQ